MSEIIELKKKRDQKKEEVKPAEELSFEEVVKRNKENAERMKKEREKANKGVIRSYRLKH
jgi:hypothetical protein